MTAIVAAAVSRIYPAGLKTAEPEHRSGDRKTPGQL